MTVWGTNFPNAREWTGLPQTSSVILTWHLDWLNRDSTGSNLVTMSQSGHSNLQPLEILSFKFIYFRNVSQQFYICAVTDPRAGSLTVIIRICSITQGKIGQQWTCQRVYLLYYWKWMRRSYFIFSLPLSMDNRPSKFSMYLASMQIGEGPSGFRVLLRCQYFLYFRFSDQKRRSGLIENIEKI